MTTTDIDSVTAELARLRNEFDLLAGKLADAKLQLDDVRSERDQEHEVAETLRVALEHNAAILATSTAIEQAVGIIAEKAGVDVTAARARLKGYSRGHDEKMSAVAASIVAAQDPATHGHGDPDVARLIAGSGIPGEFWNELTLGGLVFQ